MNRAPPLQVPDALSPQAPLPGLRQHAVGRSVRAKTSVPGQSSLVDEAYNVFCHLKQTGASIDPEEFCARYPSVHDSLARLIMVHGFLEVHSELVDVDQAVDWPE